MTNCRRCQQWQPVNAQTGRCRPCDQHVGPALQRFRAAFLHFCADGMLSLHEWATLMQGLAGDHLPVPEALAFVQADAYYFVERTLTFAAADGELTAEETAHVRHLMTQLQLAPHLVGIIEQRLARFEFLARVRGGDLPSKAPPRGLLLEAGELCHHACHAKFEKVGSRKVERIPGTIVLTQRQFFFQSTAAPMKTAWSSVMGVTVQAGGVFVQTTTKKSTGLYLVDDPDLTSAIIETVTRMDKRLLVVERPSRSIPQKIRSEVYQRYGGKCAQCSAREYLEFDHVIPVALGGANTVGNLQLLCRRCNLAKSDRI